MSELIVNNHLIDTPIIDIIKQIKKELTNGKLKEVQLKGDYVRVTCPHHADGMEKHASCGVYCGTSPDIEYGKFHCFTCNESGPLYHFVAECFERSDEFGKAWLVERFGNTLVEKEIYLPPIDITPKQKEYLDESILSGLQSWHPYFEKRKISREICEKFQLKYDPESQCIVFPVWDEHDKLYMLTRRSVNSKQFYIDPKEKPVYLLNHIIKNSITEMTVCESQINCLNLWSYGIPAVALFGTGTAYQMKIINKSGVRVIHLCLDGDEAGDHGIERFLRQIKPSILVDIIGIPRGKDVNDLTREEFEALPIYTVEEWRKLHGAK